jgi:cell division septal protein FtsQ
LARRIFTGRLLARLAAILILACGAWTARETAASPLVLVGAIAIGGNDLVADNEILGGLDVEGVNVFTVRTSRLESILKTDPAIDGAQVRARLPGKIEVQVEEREPVVVWVAQRPVLADDAGLTLRDGSRLDLPIIYAPDAPVVEVGSRVDADAVRMARVLAKALDAMGVRAPRLEYRATSGMTVIPADSPRIALGFAEDIDAKLAAYAAIKTHLEQTKTPASLIDVRFLERPYFR